MYSIVIEIGAGRDGRVGSSVGSTGRVGAQQRKNKKMLSQKHPTISRQSGVGKVCANMRELYRGPYRSQPSARTWQLARAARRVLECGIVLRAPSSCCRKRSGALRCTARPRAGTRAGRQQRTCGERALASAGWWSLTRHEGTHRMVSRQG